MATKEEILTSAEARRYLKIGRTTLYRKLHDLGIDVD